MKKNIFIGLLIGIIAGVLDVIPMIIQGLTWDANLSAFSMWIVIGFFLSVIKIEIKGIFKGFIISFLILLPNLFIIGWKEPFSLVPIFIMTTILGSLSGFIYQRITREK
jgi:hypothetical protein